MSIPVAIVSAAYVTVVELVGSVLVLAGAVITVVAACYMIVMVGAAVFVHIPHGIFAADGGWELVGAIAAVLLVLAAAGPGRWSIDHSVRTRQRSVPALEPVTPSAATSAPTSAAPPQAAGIVGRQPVLRPDSDRRPPPRLGTPAAATGAVKRNLRIVVGLFIAVVALRGPVRGRRPS
jgi:hypothetical protein